MLTAGDGAVHVVRVVALDFDLNCRVVDAVVVLEASIRRGYTPHGLEARATRRSTRHARIS